MRERGDSTLQDMGTNNPMRMRKYIALFLILTVTLVWGQGTGLVKPSSGSGVTSAALAAIADPSTDDQVIVSDSSSAATWRTLPASPQNGPTVTQAPIYDSNTNTFSAREMVATPQYGRQFSFCKMNGVTATALTCPIEGAPTVVGTSAVYAADFTTFNRSFISMTTKSASPTSGDAAGYRGSATVSATNVQPKLVLRIATAASVADVRIWAGMTSGDISGVASSTTNQGTRIAAFVFDTVVGDTTWRFITCVGTGGANSCTNTNTTLAFQASHEYICTIELNAGDTTVYWRIKDETAGTTQSGNSSSNMPATNNGIGWGVSATTLTSAQKAVWMSGVYFEQN